MGGRVLDAEATEGLGYLRFMLVIFGALELNETHIVVGRQRENNFRVDIAALQPGTE